MILPGATLGMLGGGQLGRYFTIAARNMGYRVMVLDADPKSPAGQLANVHLQADYDDSAALEKMARQCSVATIEFENVPAAALARLAKTIPVYPSVSVVKVVQNRIREKNFIRETGLQTATFAAIDSIADIDRASDKVPCPAILKTAKMGYDGKGQVQVASADQLAEAFESTGSAPCILEERIQLLREISVVVARNAKGHCESFPVAENEHRNGILHCSTVPASCSEMTAKIARAAAIKLAEALDYVGVLAVEFFETTEHRVLVNEIAPRTHNSGHYTLDACATSQFEQQLRMVCGLPHGDCRLQSPVSMVNLLGDVWGNGEPNWEGLMLNPNVKLHLYGKQTARPGRKMGHFNVLAETDQGLAKYAEALFQKLQIPSVQ